MKKWPDKNQKQTGSLEEVFRRGMADAEVEPPADLWGKLEQQLEAQEVNHYRKRLRKYQWLAAACVLLLLTLSGMWLYQQSVQQQQYASAPASESVKGKGTTTNNNEIAGTAELDKKTQNELLFGNENTQTTGPGTSEAISDRFLQNQFKNQLATNQTAKKTDTAFSTHTKTKQSTGSPLAIASAAIPLTENQAKVKSSTSSNNSVAETTGNPEVTSAVATRVRAKAGEASIENDAQESGEELVAKNSSNDFGSFSATTSKEVATGGNSSEEAFFNPFSENQSKNSLATLALLDWREVWPDTTTKPALMAAPVADSAWKPLPQRPAASRWSLLADASSGLYSENYSSTIRQNSSPYYLAPPNKLEDAIAELLEQPEKASAYQASVRVGFRLHKNLQIESGISMAEQQVSRQQEYLITEVEASVVSSYNINTTSALPALMQEDLGSKKLQIKKVTPFTVAYQYQQVGVPLVLSYIMHHGAWQLRVSGGAAAMYQLKSTIHSPERHLNDSEELQLQKWQWQSQLGASIGYQLHENLQLSAGPVAAYTLNNTLPQNDYLERGNPYTIGLRVGLQYQFLSR